MNDRTAASGIEFALGYAVPNPATSERMAAPTPVETRSGHSAPMRTRAQRALPRRAYGFRILGMGLAALPLIVVMHELQAAWPAWAWMVLTCLLWPHIAYGTILPVLHKVFPAAEAEQAHQMMASGAHIGKILISW